MRAVKKINNNTVLCTDSAGRTLIAMGKGLGFGTLPREVSLAQVERTFYDVDSQYLNALPELPQDVVELSARLVDIAAGELPYQLSPNAAFTLADHIAFAIQRAQKRIRVRMPLAYDVEQLYPIEYKLGKYALERLKREFRVALDKQEAVGIALNLVNSQLVPGEDPQEKDIRDQEMLEDITDIVEREFRLMVDREGFNYSRYATHMQYLFGRIHAGKSINSDNLQMYQSLREEFPQVAACVEKIAAHLEEEWHCQISSEERLYLILHVNRICTKE